jgi:hypothetical protein
MAKYLDSFCFPGSYWLLPQALPARREYAEERRFPGPDGNNTSRVAGQENALGPGQDGMHLNTDASMGDTQRHM